MNLQIAMRANGIRFVYDRDKLSSDVVDRLFDDVEYALAFGDTCPPDAIEADGFASAKAAKAYMKKRGADAGEPEFKWTKGQDARRHDGISHACRRTPPSDGVQRGRQD